MKKSHLFLLTIALCSCLTMSANDNEEPWQPISSWPFVYQEFEQARIITTAGKAVHGKADIHVGMHYLWFINGSGKKLAAVAGTIGRVEFKNGDVYLPVEGKLCKVVREDSINGKLCRVYRSDEVDKPRFDEMTRNSRMNSMTLDMGITGLNDMAIKVAESQAGNDIEGTPLPMTTMFYMLYDGDIFQATEGNILKHLDKSERNSYRAFTRNAEIIYSNETSILNVWSTFFVR